MLSMLILKVMAATAGGSILLQSSVAAVAVFIKKAINFSLVPYILSFKYVSKVQNPS